MLFWVRQEDRRYYRAWLQKDLLGTICVFKSYGTLNAYQGRSECTVCLDIAQAKALLREIFKTRKKQGFELFPATVKARPDQWPAARPVRQKIRHKPPAPDLFDNLQVSIK